MEIVELDAPRIAAINLGDRHHRLDPEAVIEGEVGVVREVVEVVEGGGDGGGLAAPRVADERHPVEVNPAVERRARVPGPVAEEAQVLQQQDGAGRHLAPAEVPRPGAVQEVRVHGGRRDAVARQQPGEVLVAGVGKIVHPVVPVDDERERAEVAGLDLRQVQAPVPGRFVEAESPPPFPVAGAEPAPLREARAEVHRADSRSTPSPYSGRRSSVPLP